MSANARDVFLQQPLLAFEGMSALGFLLRKMNMRLTFLSQLLMPCLHSALAVEAVGDSEVLQMQLSVVL